MENKKIATIYYALDEAGRKDSLLKGGSGKMIQTLTVDIDERILKLANVSDDGKIVLNIGCTKTPSDSYDIRNYASAIDYEIDNGYRSCEFREIKAAPFSEVMTANELIDWEENRQQYIESRRKELQPEVDKFNAIHKQKAFEEKNREQDRRKKIEQENAIIAEREEKKERDEEEFCKGRDLWIKDYGSQYLKDCLNLGYDIDKKYIEERLTNELPGFEVDLDDTAEWYTMEGPSEKAICEVKALIASGYKAKVVWLTKPITDSDEYDYDYDDDYEEREAIIILDYLNKCTLIKELF